MKSMKVKLKIRQNLKKRTKLEKANNDDEERRRRRRRRQGVCGTGHIYNYMYTFY